MHIIIKRGIAPIHLHTTVNTQHTHTSSCRSNKVSCKWTASDPRHPLAKTTACHLLAAPKSTNIKHADKIDLPSRDKTSFNLQRTIQTPPRKPGPSSRLNKQRAADAVGYLNPTPPRRPHKRGVPITGHASQSWSETRYFC